MSRFAVTLTPSGELVVAMAPLFPERAILVLTATEAVAAMLVSLCRCYCAVPIYVF